MAQPRNLFDEEFIDSGCDPSLYDSQDAVDDTVATYATNYAIGAIGVAFALLFLMAKKSATWACYFFLTGVGYAIAGVGHQVANSDVDVNQLPVILILLVANHLMLDRGLCSLTESRKARAALLVVDLAVVTANVAYNVILGGLLLLGISLLVSYVVMLAFFVYHLIVGGSIGIAFGKAFAVVLLGGGLVIQVALAGVCGSDAYEVCFEDCPLPDPMNFNHNALFHTVFAVGLLLQGIVEFLQPTGLTTVRKANDAEM